MSTTLDHGGLIARRVEDARELLAVFAPNMSVGVESKRGAGLEGLRIGIPWSLFAPFVEPAVADSFENATRVLASLGATMSEVRMPPADQIGVVTWVILLRDAALRLKRILGVQTEDVGQDLRGLLAFGNLIDDRTYAHARRLQRDLAAEVEAAFERVDLLATPTTPSTAPLLPRQWNGSHALADPPESTFMSLFNLAHAPAISVPASRVRGLPVGLQLAARHGQDAFLLRCAAAFEASSGWLTSPGIGADSTAVAVS